MRQTFIALCLLALCARHPAVAAGDWTPSASQIRDLERHLADTPARDVTKRQRYYVGKIQDGRRVIAGVLVSAEHGPPGIRIGMPDPMIADGGCGVVHVTFDPRHHKLLDTLCNGQA